EIARLHGNKNATPTMGGLFVVAALLAAVALFGDLGNQFLPPTLFAVVGLTLIGAIDDLVKLRTSRNGISARWKLAGQTIVASAAAVWLYQIQSAAPDGLMLHVPLSAAPIYLGAWFIPLAVLAIVGSSNAVNLADGLDGLAGGCLLAAAAAMTGLVYAAGHAEWAAHLGVPRIPQAGEMTVVAGAMIGAVLGFLWFNCHPAQVFLGNTGALPLGGLLGVLAVVSRQELLLAVVAGVFVVEALSVILQVGYYKWRRRRLFRCAPLHHHFQLLGWAENKIVVRFWIAAALCALIGTASLKLGAAIDPPNAANISNLPTQNNSDGRDVAIKEPHIARTRDFPSVNP
ncbi:MAG: phospho-N-acetylmuramoyl-pentapeptide-transferase, partial [Pirellulaceae bacterium]|nr:phospho-N-acetylmuramoyl-pentapeptide-transferase [Pirellulaceae bacterium]